MEVLYHGIKTRYTYDFPLCFPHELIMSLRNIYIWYASLVISPRVVFDLFDPNEFHIFQFMSACIEVYSYFRLLFCLYSHG